MQNPPPRVLYLTHRVPHPPDKGDRIRNFNVLKQLTRHTRVTLACLDHERVGLNFVAQFGDSIEKSVSASASKPRRLINAFGSALRGRSLSEGVFGNRALRQQLETWHRVHPFDAVVVSASSLVPYVRASILSTIPALIDVVDVDSQKWFDYSARVRGPNRWLYRFEGRRLRLVERAMADWAHTITLVSDAETELFNRVTGIDRAMTATNGVDLVYFQPTQAVTTPSFAFVGALDYRPNIDAAVWFVREVWPIVHRLNPQASVRIIGRNPAPAVQALTRIPGVNLIGAVPDVRPYLVDAAIVVVPMRLSRGLQNKVLEALALGKATIASPPALAALKAVPGRDLLQAATPAEWVEAMTQLLNDEPRRRELGANGRRYVEANHDWATCLKPLTDRVRLACGRVLS